MGTSNGIQLGFDLNALIPSVDGLQDLSAPFSDKEVETVIKDMPTDRAPGIDGFTGLFIKKCWGIIKEDFLTLVKVFFNGDLDIECLNTSLITLIPKKLGAELDNDYRP